jgi:hypothetical protein
VALPFDMLQKSHTSRISRFVLLPMEGIMAANTELISRNLALPLSIYSTSGP